MPFLRHLSFGCCYKDSVKLSFLQTLLLLNLKYSRQAIGAESVLIGDADKSLPLYLFVDTTKKRTFVVE